MSLANFHRNTHAHTHTHVYLYICLPPPLPPPFLGTAEGIGTWAALYHYSSSLLQMDGTTMCKYMHVHLCPILTKLTKL